LNKQVNDITSSSRSTLSKPQNICKQCGDTYFFCYGILWGRVP